jgi:indolepyruvate ferredoxin oxidoreductase
MTNVAVTLDDKYALESGRVFLTGTQALVRLPMMQRRRDASAGLKTGCFISGYRGSPLGNYDRALWQARRFLDAQDIKFQPGVNEDLAATAVWGSQQLNLIEPSDYDGVVGIWYGKGPGVDRSCDVFQHANAAGTSEHGGVLALLGDDHAAKSSTLAHQSEYAMVHATMPVLNPAGVQEFLDLGLHGIAMSRYAGVWVGFKCVTTTVDSSASVTVDPHRVEVRIPDDFDMPEGGLGIRWPDDVLEMESRLVKHKVPAVHAYVRANGLDRMIYDSPNARIGIVTTGKSYLDVMQALDDLGIDEDVAATMGLRLYKLALTWPIEPEGLNRFAKGLDEIIVVEEKRGLIEEQVKELLYNLPERPARVVGKRDETGAVLFPETYELSADEVAVGLGRRLAALDESGRLSNRLSHLEPAHAETTGVSKVSRTPYFCSGCPHNTSTRVPDGSRAVAGIGCHFLVQGMDRNTATYTQMGGEGASWIGQAPFSNTEHIFANIGDGTYFHSGLLAIRAAVASGANMTYKILFNDAVAMTGGQPVDGPLNVAQITRQVAAEGANRVAVVTDEPDKYPVGSDFAPGTKIYHREDLDSVQRDLREIGGVTVLVYDQVCATEKRRRRKRGKMIDPPRRAFINDLVCEGCGDCSVASNCVSVEPLETEFGRKRQINQSSCNKDMSCVNGFCPSFVTVESGELRGKIKARTIDGERDSLLATLTEPERPALDAPYNIMVTGVGGTGVVTVGALIGMAAHIEGRGCSVLDKVGAAQKNGAVFSQIRVAKEPEDLHALTIGNGRADLLIGCDLVVAAGREGLEKLGRGTTRAVVNNHNTPVASFIRDPDLDFGLSFNEKLVREAVGEENATFVEANAMAVALFGDAIAANPFLIGLAYQKGLLPVSADALKKAIELNGVAVAMNKRAFAWGRLAAADPDAVAAEVARLKPETIAPPKVETLDELIERCAGHLADYQNAVYAARYAGLVERARAAEKKSVPGRTEFAEAVARNAYKLMAYKDEYEVARLYTDGRFQTRLRDSFGGDFRLRFHLAPPLFASRDPQTGHLRKRAYGPYMMRAFRLLAKLRGLRGTWLDPFGYTAERRAERRQVEDYFDTIDRLSSDLAAGQHATAVEIARVPERIRGFGHVKERNLAAARRAEADLLQNLSSEPARHAAE